MMSDLTHQSKLQGILKWSLQQSDGVPGGAPPRPADPERQQWLKEALEALSAQPSETEMMKAALTILKANRGSVAMGNSPEGEGEETQMLKDAFEQLLYFTEDLDHASDLIPLDGVSVILEYLSHKNHAVLLLCCELVATATQNHTPCQQAFMPALPRLLRLVADPALPAPTRIKALYAVSCISRHHEPATRELLAHNGLDTLLLCLHSDVPKLTIKSLFLLSILYSPALPLRDALQEKLSVLVVELITLLKSCHQDRQVLGHTLSTLASLVSHYPIAVHECQRAEHDLKQTLISKCSTMTNNDDQDEIAAVEQILAICF